MDPVITLRHGMYELSIDALHGGCCANFQYHRKHLPALDLLRQMPAGCVDPFESACFAMLPYSNRLFGRRLLMNGSDDLDLERNCIRIEHPVHGVGWMNPWEVVSSDNKKTHLRYRHRANCHWPFAMELSQTVSLTDQGVRFDASICNLDRACFPAGLGFHPRFSLSPDAMVSFKAEKIWLQDARGYPAECVSVQELAQFDYSRFKATQNMVLNHCFKNWDGTAVLHRPADQLTLTLKCSSNLQHLVVYRLPEEPWLCLEPVSHASGAFSLEQLHQPEHGARVIEPGESLSAWMEVSIQNA